MFFEIELILELFSWMVSRHVQRFFILRVGNVGFNIRNSRAFVSVLFKRSRQGGNVNKGRICSSLVLEEITAYVQSPITNLSLNFSHMPLPMPNWRRGTRTPLAHRPTRETNLFIFGARDRPLIKGGGKKMQGKY